VSLLIQKSAAKLCRCRFRNQQPKIMPLLISEIDSDGGVISALLLFLFLSVYIDGLADAFMDQ
jgi:hypothetical protein